MKRNKSKCLTRFLTLSLITLSCLLTFPLFAEPLDRDNKPAKVNSVYGDVSVDDLWYNNQEPGVAYLRGSIELIHYNPKVKNEFDWGFRLEIVGYGFDENGFDEKDDHYGTIGGTNNIFTRSQTISLHVDRTHARRGERHEMLGTVWLNVKHPRHRNNVDAWQANFKVRFNHNPNPIVGLGPTTNGVDFVDNARGFFASPGGTQESLLITDAPYSQVYWYVKKPKDKTYGPNVQIDVGNGEMTKATMRYDFPENIEGTYKIIAYIYRWDLSVYELNYSVWVDDGRP